MDEETVNTTEEFFESYSTHWNTLLQQCEELYYKYARCEHLLDLYGECLEAEPEYIPRKFRNDSYHILSQEEKHIVNKSNLQKFQNECEILKLRRDRFTSQIIEKDDQISCYIKFRTENVTCIENLQKLYSDEIKNDIDRINLKWKKKIESTKKAYQRDKLKTKHPSIYNQEALNSQLPEVTEETETEILSTINKETNGNNEYEDNEEEEQSQTPPPPKNYNLRQPPKRKKSDQKS